MGHYNNIFVSTVRIVSDLVDEIKTAGIADPAFINYDSHSSVHEWPDRDVVGLAGFSFQIGTHDILVSAMVAVSTVNDTNLFRHHKILDLLVDKLLPTRTHSILNADTGAKVGWMVVTDGTEVRPAERTESRPLQYVMVSFLTSVTYQLPNQS